jgi:hypothetical protein
MYSHFHTYAPPSLSRLHSNMLQYAPICPASTLSPSLRYAPICSNMPHLHSLAFTLSPAPLRTSTDVLGICIVMLLHTPLCSTLLLCTVPLCSSILFHYVPTTFRYVPTDSLYAPFPCSHSECKCSSRASDVSIHVVRGRGRAFCGCH